MSILHYRHSFQEEAAKVWRDMSAAWHLNVPRNEETVTEELLLNLARKHKWLGLEIEAYSKGAEGKNGADWAFWFYDGPKISIETSVGVGARVQAKRLYPESGRYEKLFHQSRSQEKASTDGLTPNQCQVLLSHHDGLVPIYLFYNSSNLDLRSILKSSHETLRLRKLCADCIIPEFWGITAASAEAIKNANWGKKNDKPGDFPMVPWHCMLRMPQPIGLASGRSFAAAVARILKELNYLAFTEGMDRSEPSEIYSPREGAPKWASLLGKLPEVEEELNALMDELNLRGIAVIGRDESLKD